jgi:hypothetical protein
MTKDELLDALLHLQVGDGVLKRLEPESVEGRSKIEAAQRALATIGSVLVDEAAVSREKGRKS